jgi:hypothetical protein
METMGANASRPYSLFLHLRKTAGWTLPATVRCKHPFWTLFLYDVPNPLTHNVAKASTRRKPSTTEAIELIPERNRLDLSRIPNTIRPPIPWRLRHPPRWLLAC